MKKYPLDPWGIDNYLYAVEDSICKQYDRFDYPFMLCYAIAPLRWYIESGRASAAWLKILLSIRPDVVARRLLQGGTDLEVMDRVNTLVNSRMEMSA